MSKSTKQKNGFKNYAKYAGVIAAALIFGSWAVTNFLFQNINDYRNKLSILNGIYSEWQQQDDLFRKLGNIEKLVFRSRNTEIPPNFKDKDIVIQNMYHATLEFESGQSFYDDWLQLYKNMGKLKELCVSMGAPDSIIAKSKVNSKWCDSLYYNYVGAMHKRDSSIRKVTDGKEISLSTVSKEQAEAILNVADTYKQTIKQTGITKDYESIVNSRYRIFSDLKRWAEMKLEKLEFYSELFKWLSLVMYVLGTLLAIYGRWLETRDKESEQDNYPWHW